MYWGDAVSRGIKKRKIKLEGLTAISMPNTPKYEAVLRDEKLRADLLAKNRTPKEEQEERRRVGG